MLFDRIFALTMIQRLLGWVLCLGTNNNRFSLKSGQKNKIDKSQFRIYVAQTTQLNIFSCLWLKLMYFEIFFEYILERNQGI